MTVDALTVEQYLREHPELAARVYHDAVRDKSYQLCPIGQEAAAYLRWKRKRLTKGSERKYEAALAALADDYPHLELKDFEPPMGRLRLEEFMEKHWGPNVAEPRTYNSNLSPIKDFFAWAHDSGLLSADPARRIERAKPRDPHRETFGRSEVEAIYAACEDVRDRLCLQLLLDYALRKNELRNVQFKHFDHLRKTLTVFGKGGTVQPIPVDDPAFWHELERLILETEAEPYHYLMPGRRGNRHGSRLLPEKQISNHALHDWFYARQVDAGILPTGTTKGSRMHKARHTALQNLYDETKDIKLTQRLARHKSAQTTMDTYVGSDLDELAEALAEMRERRRGR